MTRLLELTYYYGNGEFLVAEEVVDNEQIILWKSNVILYLFLYRSSPMTKFNYFLSKNSLKRL